MSRKTWFWFWFFVVVLGYVFPIASAIYLQAVWMLTVVCIGFLFSVYVVYWFTIKKKKPKYPLVPPEGLPDIYTMARIPRPIYEDVEQYPWLFNKKSKKLKKLARWTKKLKKKH